MSYQLSTSDLDPILAAIEERFEEARPSTLQVISSRILLAANFAFVMTYLLYLVMGDALIDLLTDLALIWIGLQVISMLFSWRYLPVVKRQRRLYRDLDLVAPDPTPGLVWKKRTAKQQALVRGAVGIVLVVVFGAVVLNFQNGSLVAKELPGAIGMLGLIAASACYVWSDRKISLGTTETLLAWIKFGLLVGLAVAVFLNWLDYDWEDWSIALLAVLWPAWLLVKSRQIARIQERFAPLGRAGGLRESLAQRRQEASASGSEVVSLAPEDVAGLAYAESEMIRQDRVEAISESKIERAERWGVSLSDAAHRQLREFDPTDRLKIQDAISALSTSGARESAAGGDPLRTLEVEGTTVGLRYRLDGEARRVTVVELVSPEARSDG